MKEYKKPSIINSLMNNTFDTIKRKKPLAITAIILLVFLLPLVSSLSYKSDTLINLKVPCSIDGAVCSASATCNITIIKPDGDYLINSKEMINGNNGIFNYSFSSSVIGMHEATVFCIDAGQNGTSTFDIDITKSGTNDTSSFYWFIIAISFGIILLGFYLLSPYITVLGTFGLYFVGIHFIRYGFADRYDIVVWVVGIIILALAAIISIKSVLEVIQEFE
jgi:hypothetical protein